MPRFHFATLSILAASGALMGALSLFGLYGAPVEFALWTLLGAAVWAPLCARTDAPWWNGTAGGLAAGIATGAVQAIGQPTYLANHPEFTAEPGPPLAAQFLGFAIMIGLVWGILFGAIAIAIRRWRSSRRIAPA